MDKEIINELKEISKKLTEQNRLVSLVLQKQDEYMYFQKINRSAFIVLLWIFLIIGIILL